MESFPAFLDALHKKDSIAKAVLHTRISRVRWPSVVSMQKMQKSVGPDHREILFGHSSAHVSAESASFNCTRGHCYCSLSRSPYSSAGHAEDKLAS